MEVALKVLRLLLEYDAKAGTNVATLEAMDWWLDVEEDDAETFFFGLAQATIEGWVVSKAPGKIQITTAGIAAVNRSLH
jgi:hypothetical protein